MPALAAGKTLSDVLAGNDDALAVEVTASTEPGAARAVRLTRGELRAVIGSLARRLAAAGVAPGDVVSLSMTNTIEFLITFMAITQARAVAAPFNAAYKQDEFTWYMDDAKTRLLILPATGNPAAAAAAAALNIPVATVELAPRAAATTTAPELLVSDAAANGGNISLASPAAAAAAADAAAPTPAPLPADVALFLHTSGTTSKPKGVPLTHANIAASVANIGGTYELTPADVSYMVMPLFHVHGLMAGTFAPLAAGGAVILPAAGRFSASVFWPECVAHGATFYTAVPTMHQVLLERAPKDYPAAAPPPLRFIRSCSSSLAAPTHQALEETFKVPVLEAYAMTEASHQMTSNPLPKHGSRKPGSVGKAQGGVSVAILDAAGAPVAGGEVGEVCIKGANVTAGYLNNPTANKEAFTADGWFRTGDHGRLDEEGYLFLTGRIKELINRGGEKISPLEVDAALLAHPAVAEAISFGAPDPKYGEIVAAAVVLKDGALSASGLSEADLIESIRAQCAKQLSSFKVPGPGLLFITDALPKGATGKVQRRHMPAAFLTPKETAGAGAAAAGNGAAAAAAAPLDGFTVIAKTLAKLGIKHMFGVIGIPVTQLASAAQAAGVRFVSHRNEQAAGYAAAAAGYLKGVPAALLSVSGPGAVHAIAGAAHAQANCWPLLMLAGSCETSEVGKGAFQECDQVTALRPFCKFAERATTVASIPALLASAVEAASTGRPGASYLDLPSDVLMATLPAGSPDAAAALAAIDALSPPVWAAAPAAGAAATVVPGRPMPRPLAPAASIADAAALLRAAQRPLLVVGKGAAYSGAEAQVLALAEGWGIPVLNTNMGRGMLADSHRLCANAARSMALKGADVALVVGARLNWQLHFGEPPRWSEGVKFILVDPQPSERDVGLAALTLPGDAAAVLDQLTTELASDAPSPARAAWASQLSDKSAAAAASLEKKLAAAKGTKPLDYFATLGAIKNALAKLPTPPVIVAEGANTMDNARLVLPASAPRARLDAGTWGTMGVGLGYAIAAAIVEPGRLVVTVQGDSAFGFSGMEVETAVRYKLPIVVIVFNNGGIYGGDRRPATLAAAAAAGAAAGGFPEDPIPTAFVPTARHDLMMAAFEGDAYHVADDESLSEALNKAFAAKRPALIDVAIDPMAGVESGTVHAFNAPPVKAT